MRSNIGLERTAAFTLVELMVSLGVFLLLLSILLAMVNHTTTMWNFATRQSEEFKAASAAFASVNRRLSQATLNTYWDYDDPVAPTKYQRQSQLRLVTDKAERLIGSDARRPGAALFFQAPLGYTQDPEHFGELPNLLNTWGYYLEFGGEDRPAPIEQLGTLAPSRRYRYRLMELMEPSESLGVYSAAKGVDTWFKNPLTGTQRQTHVLAENIVQFIIQPKLAQTDELQAGAKGILAPAYRYDSADSAADSRWLNQLPPLMQVTMVAVDEISAARVSRGSSPPSYDAELDTFSAANNFNADLQALEKNLTARKLHYRVFSANVSIRGARWSP